MKSLRVVHQSARHRSLIAVSLVVVCFCAACRDEGWPKAKVQDGSVDWTVQAPDPDSGKLTVLRRVLRVWFASDATPEDVRHMLSVARGEVLETGGQELVGRRFYSVLLPDVGDDPALMRSIRDSVRALAHVASAEYDGLAKPKLELAPVSQSVPPDDLE